MAKTLLLGGILVAIIVAARHAAAAAAPPVDLSPVAKKSIDDLSLKLQKVVDAVATAAPPAKQAEARSAAQAHLRTVGIAFAKAKKTGDEKKVAGLVLSFQIAAAMVTAAPPAEKLEVMEDAFNSAAAPSPAECPAGDKPYCEMYSKIQMAFIAAVAAAPLEKKLELKETLLKKTMHDAVSTINKAYAEGDDNEEIARVLAAYTKAADEVIAAPPADKLKVMEETFAAAARPDKHH